MLTGLRAHGLMTVDNYTHVDCCTQPLDLKVALLTMTDERNIAHLGDPMAPADAAPQHKWISWVEADGLHLSVGCVEGGWSRSGDQSGSANPQHAPHTFEVRACVVCVRVVCVRACVVCVCVCGLLILTVQTQPTNKDARTKKPKVRRACRAAQQQSMAVVQCQ